MPYIPRQSKAAKKRQSERPAFSGHKNDNSKFYQSRRWRKVRLGFLQEHPICRLCEIQGRIRPASVVDHIIPIAQGGDMWDKGNFQALCASCHNRKSGREGAQATFKK